MKPINYQNHLAGGLLGLLVGDALGVPYEFHASSEIPAMAQIEMVPPTEFHRSHPGVLPGTWSDDGALALCVMETLLLFGFVDQRDLANRFIAWKTRGHNAIGGKVFDIGCTTAGAIQTLERGGDPMTSGEYAENSCGNGSLMRVLPVALWVVREHARLNDPDEIDIVTAAHLQSTITHAHPLCAVSCALYVLAALNALDLSRHEPSDEAWSETDPFRMAVVQLRSVYSHPRFRGLPYSEQLDRAWAYATNALENYRSGAAPLRGTGFVLDSLTAAMAFWHLPYEEAVRRAIALGGDTDTTAAIVGGFAGLVQGMAAIPERWGERLGGVEIALPIIIELIAPPSKGVSRVGPPAGPRAGGAATPTMVSYAECLRRLERGGGA